MKRELVILMRGLLVLVVGSLFSHPATAARDLMVYHGEPIPAEVDAVYARGVAWLVANHQPDGSWGGPRGREPGVVGLAVLALMARGEDPNYGPHSGIIGRSLNFILENMDEATGFIGRTMYNHGFATLALAEAYGVVQDPRLGPALQKAVDLIVSAQERNPTGGWRYLPTRDDADTTITGGILMALLAARNAGITVPDHAIERGMQLITSHQSENGGFGYLSAAGTTPSSSAIGALMIAMTGNNGSAEHRAALQFLDQTWLEGGNHRYYYLYYASQAFFHGDMQLWRRWSAANRAQLISNQLYDGSWGSSGGDAFGTSAALLSLALYYRYLPIYER